MVREGGAVAAELAVDGGASANGPALPAAGRRARRCRSLRAAVLETTGPRRGVPRRPRRPGSGRPPTRSPRPWRPRRALRAGAARRRRRTAAGASRSSGRRPGPSRRADGREAQAALAEAPGRVVGAHGSRGRPRRPAASTSSAASAERRLGLGGVHVDVLLAGQLHELVHDLVGHRAQHEAVARHALVAREVQRRRRSRSPTRMMLRAIFGRAAGSGRC